MSVGDGNFPYQPADLNQDGQRSWGPLERAVLTAIIEYISAQVTIDGLNINGDLDIQGHGLINAAFVQMVLDGDTGALRSQYTDANGDLWFRDASDREIQVTSGGALAVGAALGGFASDYIGYNSSGAAYSISSGEFKFTNPSPANDAATLNVGPVHIRQGADADYVGLAVPANLAGSYTLTFPDGLPTTRTFAMVDATGSVSYDASMTRDARGLIATGSIKSVGALTVVGSVSGSQSGSFEVLRAHRDILHDNTFSLQIPASAYAISRNDTSTAEFDSNAQGFRFSLGNASGSANQIIAPIPLKVGDEIRSWKLFVSKGSSSGQVTAQLNYHIGTTTGPITIGSKKGTADSSGLYTLTGSDVAGLAASKVLADRSYFLNINGGGSTGDYVYHTEVFYNRATGSV